MDLVQGSKFKISIVEVYGYETFDFEILDDGEWENENAREKEGPSESDLKEPQTPVQQASKFSFTKLSSCVSDIVNSLCRR